jgi:crossover junction endodeoxyribonuclease RusA
MNAPLIAAQSRDGALTTGGVKRGGIVLPFPAKVLWPNGRTLNHKFKAAAFRKAREQAAWAAKAANLRVGNSPIPVHLIVKPKAKGPAPDADNCVSACKAYFDGIAAAIGINDRHFAAPTVEIDGERTGQFVICIGETQ